MICVAALPGAATGGSAAASICTHWLTPPIVVEDVGVHGYSDSTYGDGFADVYDDWYGQISDVAATVGMLAGLAVDGAPILELGVGTGRLAVPLAAAVRDRGIVVHGLDASEAMLAKLTANDPAGMVRPVRGSMVDAIPEMHFGLVFVAYNTFFNLLTRELQSACFAAVADRLAANGSFVLEAFVPEEHGPAGEQAITLRSMSVDRVVLSVSRGDPARQVAEGQYIEISETGGVRLRPWSVRYASPEQLDEMAGDSGLSLIERLENFEGGRFDTHSARHVSVYRRN